MHYAKGETRRPWSSNREFSLSISVFYAVPHIVGAVVNAVYTNTKNQNCITSFNYVDASNFRIDLPWNSSVDCVCFFLFYFQY